MSDHRTTLSGHSRGNNNMEEGETPIREIHALQPPSNRVPWDTSSHVSSNSMSMASDNFTTMSREFSALVVAGSAIIENDTPGGSQDHDYTHQGSQNNMLLGMIGEGRDDVPEETNPLAIVHQPPLASPETILHVGPVSSSSSGHGREISVQRVKMEETESKITAWQNAKVAKINNRFKCEDAIIVGWENAQVERASASMKKVERKLEEKRARAMEKMQNDIAKAHRKAEEKRASAEAKRGTKVAKVLEICNLMRALGRDPSKRSFF